MRPRRFYTVAAAMTVCACGAGSSDSSVPSSSDDASFGSSGTGSSGSNAASGTGSSTASVSSSGATGEGTGSGPATGSGSSGISASSGGSGSSDVSSSGSSGGSGIGGGPDAGTAVKSLGCGKTPTIQGGQTNPIAIESNGVRHYLLRVPDNYDNTHPYRLVIAYHESGATAKAVWGYDFYKLWDMADNSTIFVAPDGLNGGWANTNGEDVALTDAILAQVEGDRCIDKTRIFATGFSYGGAMCIAIACARPDVFRAVAFFSGANLSGCEGGTMPIAYYASQASQDHGALPANSPIAGEVMQAKFAAVDGCTAQDAIIPATGSGKVHVCTNYRGCSFGHPVEYCGFDGPHGWQPVDPGQTTSWAPPEAWKFITQF